MPAPASRLCVFLNGHAAGLELLRRAEALEGGKTAAFLIWLDDETLGGEFRKAGASVHFVHLLPGDQLFTHTRLVRELLHAGEFDPREHDQLLASLLYTETRFYYPLKRFFAEGGFAQVHLLEPRSPTDLPAVVLAASRAAGVTAVSHSAADELLDALRRRKVEAAL